MGFTKSMFIFGTAKEGDSFEFLFPYEGDQLHLEMVNYPV